MMVLQGQRGVHTPPKYPGVGGHLAWPGDRCHAMLSLISRPHFSRVVWARDYAMLT